ncbi:Thiol-disulfide isomerase or thioredoxin [Chitinophaga jiangningensis]|uniref:Thiol-disulfide isomerase or thioredoxin n=1 Tax=Chitinophaga jiangningensis TaxID=1419482 RepID=A0A1M7DXF6_9BACT|nr:thioredoxin domain-containing protein [Chitinophaga jiangningensis]SHL84126.1 Thiol-disulfide isomerase or thioredoxin [Chitinophaga jiangningensis]
MRLKMLLLGGGLLLSSLTWAQSNSNDKVLKGKIDMKTLMNGSDYTWFYKGVNDYQPNDNMLNYIKSNRSNFNVVAVLGTWDQTSRDVVPQLYKVMIMGGSPEEQVTMFGADQKMNTDAPTDYKVKKVPTIIVFKDGKEEGRIVGAPKESIEADLSRILLKSSKGDKPAKSEE